MFTLLSVVVIANLKSKNITKAMIITGGALGIYIPYLVPYVNHYISEPLTDFLFECLLILLLL